MYSTRVSRTNKPFRNTKPLYRKRKNLLTKEHKLFLMIILIPTAGYVVFSILNLNEEIHYLRNEIRHFKSKTEDGKINTQIASAEIDTTESSTIDIMYIGDTDFSTEKASSELIALITTTTTSSSSLEIVSPVTEQSVVLNFDTTINKTELVSTEGFEFDMFAITTSPEELLIRTEDPTSIYSGTSRHPTTATAAMNNNIMKSILKTTTKGSKIVPTSYGSQKRTDISSNHSNIIHENFLKSTTEVTKTVSTTNVSQKKIYNFSIKSSTSTSKIMHTGSSTSLPKLNHIVEKKIPLNLKNEKHKYEAQSKLTCHIPRLNPYDPSILKYITGSPEKYDCTEKYNLIFYTDFDSHLIINGSLREHNISYCCYKNLSRGETDDKFRIHDKCTRIKKKKTKIAVNFDFIAIFCRNKTSNKEELFDMFGFVHPKAEVEGRIKIANANLTLRSQSAGKVNVMILGLDGISHMNFIRTMPKAHSFIAKNLSAVSMNGYSKVGDNTIPNLLPALMGQSGEEAKSNCYGKTNYFDDCPFIWKNFSAAGYRTVYAEDVPKMSTFNYWKLKGFRKSPTDYNIRPLFSALEKSMASHHSMNVDLCYGPRLAFEIILDYLKKVAYTCGKNKNYFGLWWSNVISHDKLNNPKMGDELLLNTLQWLSTGNYLDNTILIVTSDHGIRWGGIRNTYQGIIEERMPLLYTVFPKWFTEKYKIALHNFKLNSERLTSPFDLYETLKDFLNLENLDNGKIATRSNELMLSLKVPRFNSSGLGPRGISLFLPIPLFRDCKQAEILDHYCVCHEMVTVSLLEHSGEINSTSTSLANTINKKISKFPQCALLKIKTIISARRMTSTYKAIQDKIKLEEKGNSPKYIINFVTTPGDGNFEATVFKKRKRSNWVVSGEISRISLYGNQSHCVTENDIKKFCYCK